MHGQAQYNSYFPLPGGAKAYELSGAWLEVHGDWLASARLTTNPGSLYRALSYAPYGEMYADSAPGAPSQWFTGVDSDVRNDLSDFPFREYSSIQGRWPSPDPAGLAAINPADPQTWNDYAYVANQPLNATDPLGLTPLGPPPLNLSCLTCPDQSFWYGSGPNLSPGLQISCYVPSVGADSNADPGDIEDCNSLATTGSYLGGGIAPETVPVTGKLQLAGPACEQENLNAVNNQFGTDLNTSDVEGMFQFSTGAPAGVRCVSMKVRHLGMGFREVLAPPWAG